MGGGVWKGAVIGCQEWPSQGRKKLRPPLLVRHGEPKCAQVLSFFFRFRNLPQQSATTKADFLDISPFMVFVLAKKKIIGHFGKYGIFLGKSMF